MLVVTPPDLTRFAPYRITRIEQEYRHEVPTDMLHTPLLDFVDLDKFKPRGNDYLAAEDEALVKPESGGKETKGASETPRGGRAEVTWLRRTEYLATEVYHNRPKAAAPTGTPERREERVQLASRKDVAKAIEQSFQRDLGLDTLRHPTKPGVTAAMSYPILPNSDNVDSYVQCTFDADPAVANVDGIGVAAEGEQRALMKAMGSEDDAFVWYYLPTGEGTDRFVYTRDYDIQRVDRQAALHFVLSIPHADGDAVQYTPVSGHFTLKKRRTKTDHSRQRHSLNVVRT